MGYQLKETCDFIAMTPVGQIVILQRGLFKMHLTMSCRFLLLAVIKGSQIFKMFAVFAKLTFLFYVLV